MKEIKLKAYSKEHKKVFPVIRIDFESQSLIVDTQSLDEAFDVLHLSFSDVELLQYIGRRDMDATDIFEGDILLLESDKYVEVSEGSQERDVPWGSSQMEVVGNVFENPELLEY